VDKSIDTSDTFRELRKRAQAYISKPSGETAFLSQDAVKKLVYELDTYQIELELQNNDLRKSQLELEKSQRRISDLYEFAPVGYLTISEKGLIIEANLTAADILETPKNLLLNKPLSAYIVAEDQDIHYLARKKLLEKGGTQTYVCSMKIRTGNKFFAQFKSSINPELDGQSGQFRTVITDVTEQKELEDAIFQSKVTWEKTFDAMNDIVTLLDKDLCIIRANKRTQDFFKAQAEELIGRHCYELFGEISTPCKDCSCTMDTSRSKGYGSKEVCHRFHDKLFMVSITPVFEESGELKHLVHVARDITEKNRLEEELLQSHKMDAMGNLAGGIAHDFNNILAAILGYAELIKNNSNDPKRIEEFIDQVLKAGNRAKELVKQILTFSRKENGKNDEPLKPQTLVKEVLKLLRATFPVSMEIREIIDPQCHSILLSPTSFHQVLMNLCTNAFQAMENERGVLTVELTNKTLNSDDIGGEQGVQPGQFVELLVHDTGSGIDKSVVNHIFEPYYTTKGIGKGSGIGLAVVYGIVKSHNGMIKIESKDNKGTTFRIYFPSSKIQSQNKEPAEKNEMLPSGTEKILIVDDEEMIVIFLKTILEDLGYGVTTYTESRKALDDFSSHPMDFDLIISDQTMPHMTGLELSTKILEQRNDIPIILCTGNSSMITEEKAKSLGIRHLALKPLNIKELAIIVRDTLGS